MYCAYCGTLVNSRLLTFSGTPRWYMRDLYLWGAILGALVVSGVNLLLWSLFAHEVLDQWVLVPLLASALFGALGGSGVAAVAETMIAPTATQS